MFFILFFFFLPIIAHKKFILLPQLYDFLHLHLPVLVLSYSQLSPHNYVLCVFVAWVAVTGALSVAERSYPTSEVRGRSQEDPMPEERRPRGVTLRPRSGAVAESARL